MVEGLKVEVARAAREMEIGKGVCVGFMGHVRAVLVGWEHTNVIITPYYPGFPTSTTTKRVFAWRREQNQDHRRFRFDGRPQGQQGPEGAQAQLYVQDVNASSGGQECWGRVEGLKGLAGPHTSGNARDNDRREERSVLICGGIRNPSPHF